MTTVLAASCTSGASHLGPDTTGRPYTALGSVSVRHHGVCPYVDGHLTGGTALPLCCFAIYQTNRDKYKDNAPPPDSPLAAASLATATAGSNPRRTNPRTT
jgi:hypothetical protein